MTQVVKHAPPFNKKKPTASAGHHQSRAITRIVVKKIVRQVRREYSPCLALYWSEVENVLRLAFYRSKAENILPVCKMFAMQYDMRPPFQ
jgi:endonuclease III